MMKNWEFLTHSLVCIIVQHMIIRPSVLNIPPYHPGKKVSGALKLSSNENPLGPSPMALEAIQNHLRGLHVYPDGSGAVLTEALSDVYGLDPGQFILGNGSDEIFTMVAGLVLEPGDWGVTAKQTFSQYDFAIKVFGGHTIEVPLDDSGSYDLHTIAAYGQKEKTKVIFLCNPNNPTGTWHSHEKLRDFLSQIPPRVLVVLDEAYGEYADDPLFPDSMALLQEFPNLLVTRTFSKIYGIAGLRVGYGMGSVELIDHVKRLKSPFNINNLGLVGARAALNDTDFVQTSLRINREGKKRLYKLCGDLGLETYPTQGNFICVKLDTPLTADRAYTLMAEAGVTIRSLTSFGLPDSIRITVGSSDQLDVLQRAMEGIAQGDKP